MDRTFKDGFFFFFWGTVFGISIGLVLSLLISMAFGAANIKSISIEKVVDVGAASKLAQFAKQSS